MIRKRFLCAFVAILLLSTLSACKSDPAASVNYGKGYYYNSQTKKVEKSLWGITHGVP